MKKIIFCLSVLLGLVSLTACEETTSITYVDSNGEEQTLKVTATEDKETIQTVMDFASKANYDEIDSFTLKETISVSANFSNDFTGLLGWESKAKLLGSADMTLSASKKEGLDLSASGQLSIGKEISSFSVDALYEGELEKMPTSKEYLYLDASYASDSSREVIKRAIHPMTLIDELEDEIFSKFFPTNIPSIGDGMGSMTVEEFYKTFENSKLVISGVKNGVIYLEVTLALKDVLKQIDVDKAELNTLLSKISFTCTYGIEASTGRFCEFGFVFDNAEAINALVLNYIGNIFATAPSSELTLVESFLLESKLAIKYNKATIRTLSASEKAKYEVI
ncbi:MAG: hypothetical protein K2K50_05480, partial [Anaeroplasmataceae bacterium]|nr:hypothetical protein [Anaeroplasmataceae bacterium]